jgi:uncharacterized protein YwgA
MALSRYKPVGWQRQSYRHYLAAKGIKTRYDYRARKPYPDLYVTETVPEIPVIGMTTEEKAKQLEARIALSEAEYEAMQKEAAKMKIFHPIAAVKVASQESQEEAAEVARLQAEYDALVAAHKKIKQTQTYASKKQILTTDEFAEQIHAEHPTLPFSEVKRLAAHRRLAALSEKEHGRGEYFSKQVLEQSDWKEIQKAIAKKKKADPTTDERSTLFEEIWTRKKPEDLPLFVHSVSDVPYSGKVDIETKKTKVEVKNSPKAVAHWNRLVKKKAKEPIVDDDQPKKKKRVILEHVQDDEFKRLKAEFEKTGKFKEVNK